MDNETKIDLGPKWIRIRDRQGNASVGLTARMEEVWGLFPEIKTGTDIVNSLIYIYKATTMDSPTVSVNRYATGNAINFSLDLPLTKLGIKVPKNRQYEVQPYEQRFDDGSVAFVLPMGKKKSVPRNLKDEEAGQETNPDQTQTNAATAANAGAKNPLDPKLANEVKRVKKMMDAEKAALKAELEREATKAEADGYAEAQAEAEKQDQ
jgi:hypothetical protein